MWAVVLFVMICSEEHASVRLRAEAPAFISQAHESHMHHPAAVGSPPGLSEAMSEHAEATVGGAVVPPPEDFSFIAVPSGRVEATNTMYLDGYWQRRGKCTAKHQIRRFFMSGVCYWKGRKITSYQQLAQTFDSQLTEQVWRRLEMQRVWWAGQTQLPPKAPPRRCFPAKQLKCVSYNICSAHGERLSAVLHRFWHADVIALQGTRFRVKAPPKNGVARAELEAALRSEWVWENHFHVVSWGYTGGAHTNKCAGVLIALNLHTFSALHIRQRFDPTHATAGRFGGLRVQTRKEGMGSDLFFGVVYAPQERDSAEGRDAFQQVLHQSVARLPVRCTEIYFGDFNGDVIPSESSGIGPLHAASSVSTENGCLMQTLCESKQLDSSDLTTQEAREVKKK